MTAAVVRTRDASSALGCEDIAFQEALLPGVSRTFALTIPELPVGLREVVTNAYLLCRIADTIEDEPALELDEKRRFERGFAQAVAGEGDLDLLARELTSRLSQATLPDERDLVAQSARVVRITHMFAPTQRRALARCVRVMSEGMERFQSRSSLRGLRDVPDLDSYCYHVAGCVGEMLTELFCDYSTEIAAQRSELADLAVSFGQGLQMTNILKDIWDDRERGACWLPRDVFERRGVDLERLDSCRTPGFEDALGELIGIAHYHLRNALRYTLMIPAHEKRIRRFCLWALGMAVLTLRKINSHRDFTESRTVKIKRRSVRATVLVSNLSVTSDRTLRTLFSLSSIGLPAAPHPAPVAG